MSFGEYIGAGSGTTLGLYRFENNLDDSSGNGATLTAQGTAIYNTDISIFGSNLYFNGSSQFSRSNPLGTGNISFTFGCLFYIRSADSGRARAEIFMIGLRYVTNGGIMFSVRPKSGGNSAIYMDYAHVAGFSTNMRVVYDKWNYFGVIKNGNSITVFLNGVFETFTKSGLNIGSNTYFSIGDYGLGVAYFKGSIDEVIIENIAWSPVEIQKYYTASKGWF